MDGQQLQLGLQALPGLAGLLGGVRRAEHHVAEQPGGVVVGLVVVGVVVEVVVVVVVLVVVDVEQYSYSAGNVQYW